MEQGNNYKNLIIRQRDDQVVIIKKWNKEGGIALMVFSVFWTGITLFMLSGTFGDLFSAKGPALINLIPVLFSVIPIFFLLLGFGLFYLALAMIMNSSTIELSDGLLTSSAGPVPLMRKKQLPREAVKQIFVEGHVANGSSTTTRVPTTFQLSFINSNHQIESLLGKMGPIPYSLPYFQLHEARMLENLIEQHWNIQNQAVANEYTSSFPPPPSHKTLEEEIESSNKEYWKQEEYSEKEADFSTQEKEMQENSQTLTVAPGNLLVEESVDGLFIFKKWYSPFAYFLLFFAIIWNAVVWSILSVVFGAILSGNMYLLLFIGFMTPFFGVGIWILFMSLSMLLNHTRIIITNGQLKVSHRPVPMGRNQSFSLHNIRSLKVEEVRRSGKSGYTLNYKLNIEFREGKNKDLLKNRFLNLDKEEADFLAQKINKYLV